MPIEDRTCRIRDWIVLIVTFGEHGIERGDRAAATVAVAGPLDQLRELGKYRGRIALGRRRLIDRQADLALRLREAGQ